MQECARQCIVYVDSLEICKVTISECHFKRQDNDGETMTEFKESDDVLTGSPGLVDLAVRMKPGR